MKPGPLQPVKEALRLLALDTKAKLPVATPLRYNDISLPDGGLFDIDAPWQRDHCSHRWGVEVDMSIRGYTDVTKYYLEALCRHRGFSVYQEPDSTHWHLTSHLPYLNNRR